MLRFASLTAILATTATCLHLNVNNISSIRSGATALAANLFTYHDPSSTVGQFVQPQPWFWWLSGSGWTSLIDYTAYTNDTTYIPAIQSALLQNVGSNYDFVPASQAGWEANDDQVYWVYAALTAMEYGFPPLPCEPEASAAGTTGSCQNTSWLTIANNAFEDFVTRWQNNSITCNGGLEWQYNPSATGNGWTYKNTVTNGGFFQTAARLARFTGNATYAEWANRIWDWSAGVGLISPDFHVFDGTSDGEGANCSSVNHDEWSYNIASYLHGAANMYAFTHINATAAVTTAPNATIWQSRTHGLLAAANQTFFSPFPNATGIMYEPNCELAAKCNTDQASFKGSLATWMAKTSLLVPSTKGDIFSLLPPSAVGAAASCEGVVGGAGVEECETLRPSGGSSASQNLG
ncbi:hypothetical protein LTR86_009544 [Recurvomyces mirabilis]|nr:hypothetical protein LTR86_009544 [Recurvomyces mirabilis]